MALFSRGSTRLIFYTSKFIPERFAGFNIGPVSFIRPEYRDDAGLAAHENMHQQQFWRSLGVLGLLYLVSKKWRLVLEVEAYKEQLKYYPDDRRLTFAGFLATRYNLGITEIEALGLLT